MIVRILGEGQYQLGDAAAAKLTELDKQLDAAVEKGDEPAFAAVLDSTVRLVRESGSPVPADSFETADFILPFSDATLDEVRKLLADGKIPGDSLGFPAPGPA
jgi:PspAA-like protein